MDVDHFTQSLRTKSLTPIPISNELWKSDREQIVSRNADAVADAVAPLLRMSREIFFIDPHFGPERARYRHAVQKFLERALNSERRTPVTRIEIHTNATSDINFFSSECRRRLCPIIPNGVRIRLVRWTERPNGEKLHNRFILTDIGGISFRTGLDAGAEGQTDEISLLTPDVYRVRFEQYIGSDPAYNFVDDVTIAGTG